jgi:cytochrome c oxidase cbb3-type subunit IV
MEAYSTLSSIFTVVSFFVFSGIVWWAWSARRKASFDAAAIEPFALADEASAWNPDVGARAAPGLVNTSQGVRP